MRTIRRKEQEETDISQTEGVVEAAPFFMYRDISGPVRSENVSAMKTRYAEKCVICLLLKTEIS